MRRTYLFLFILIICVVHTYGQKRNNMWVFGNHTGLDFNTTHPTPLKETSVGFITPMPPDIKLPYYVSSICDTSGKLLFYTDGVKVWDKQNNEILKYLSRWPWSQHVMPLICPYSGNDSLYYIFGVSDGSYAHRLQYLTINMKGNMGRGEIVYPQPSTLSNYYNILLNDASMLVAGTGHCNGMDVWIVSHAGNALYSFLVSAEGVDSVAVVSQIDAAVISPTMIDGGLGNMKFSANGEKMVIPVANEKKIVVFDFDNSTGKFNNPVALRLPEGFYLEDVELSPDGSKLYYGAYEIILVGDENFVPLHDVFQMDLNGGTAENILNTNYKLTVHADRDVCNRVFCINTWRTLQMAPDGKIYVSMRYAGDPANFELKMSVIENPNMPGALCFYRPNALDIATKYGIISYNYIRTQTFTPATKGIQVQPDNCADKPVLFSLLYNNVDSVKWDFGDPSSGSNNYSILLKSQHTYPSPGIYTAKAIIYKECFVDTAVVQFMISQTLSVYVPPSIKDTTVCTGDILYADATTADATGYLWNNGFIYANQKIPVAGTYLVMVYNSCSSDRREFTVTYNDCECNVFVPNAFTPNGDGLNDVFKPVMYCFAKNVKFIVYNRYGSPVYSTASPGAGWDGYIGSTPASSETYVWRLQYQNPNDKHIYQQHGTVLLIR